MVLSSRRSRRFPWRARGQLSVASRSTSLPSCFRFRRLISDLPRLYKSLTANSEWMDDLREADVIFVATHSQGSVVSTHLMSKLLQEGIIYTRPEELVPSGGDTFPSAVGIPRSSERKLQRVCCLALCGIHLGPLRYLSTSSLVAPYIQVRA